MLRIAIVVVAYLAANTLILIVVGKVFDGKAGAMCEEVVREHAHRICDMLGIDMPPIEVVDGFNSKMSNIGGVCEHEVFYGLFVEKRIVVRRVVLYTRAIVRGAVAKETLPAFIGAFSFRERMYRMAVKCLAHELRHAWQFKTGWILEHSSNLMYRGNAFAVDLSMVPYAQRNEEKDANAFADEYLQSIRRK